MTIKTLTYIHELMKQENETRKNAYQYIKDIAYKAIDEKAPNAQYLSDQKDKAWEKWTESTNALADFEAQEW